MVESFVPTALNRLYVRARELLTIPFIWKRILSLSVNRKARSWISATLSNYKNSYREARPWDAFSWVPSFLALTCGNGENERERKLQDVPDIDTGAKEGTYPKVSCMRTAPFLYKNCFRWCLTIYHTLHRALVLFRLLNLLHSWTRDHTSVVLYYPKKSVR